MLMACARFCSAGLVLVAAAQAGAAPPGKFRPPSTTVQLPTFGISIEAGGVLAMHLAADPTGQLHRQRMAAARAGLPADLQRASELRKVSLVQLERALAARLDEDKLPDDAMRHLAGLQQIRYVFCYPQERDIVIAGPAEGWVDDGTGRAVGMTSGQPTLELVDLAVALRAYPPGGMARPMVGCTIDPSQAGLAALARFQQTIPRTVSTAEKPRVQKYVAQGIGDALGLANVRVFGVPAGSHFAHVMIEADYRMKRIGIGLEQPAVKLASYLDLMRTPRMGMLQRWWFTPDYDALRVADDRLALELVGQGVRLQTEDNLVDPTGQLQLTTLHDKASEQFVAGFTARFPQLAETSSVFSQLHGLVDMLIAAAYIQKADYYGQTDWQLGVLGDEARLPVANLPEVLKAPAAVNCVWRGSRLLAPAGGGVSIHAHLALEPEHIKPDEAGALKQQRDEVAGSRAADAWWWD